MSKRLSDYNKIATGDIQNDDIFEVARPLAENYKMPYSLLKEELGEVFPQKEHATRHQVTGADAINVTGLDGVLSEQQKPQPHSSSHGPTGPDTLNVNGLSGLLADQQTPLSHDNTYHSQTFITDTLEHGNEKHNPDFSMVGTATGQIGGLTEKMTPVADDLFIIEDSAATLNPKKLKYSQLESALAGEIPGEIRMYGGTSAPTGWFLCDGQEVSRTTYSDLFDVLGTKYGSGDGSTTFNIPNLKGRMPVGLDSSIADFDDRGKSGGSKTHILTTAQLAAHSHTTPGIGTSASASAQVVRTCNETPAVNVATNSVGSGEAHENMSPYLIVNFIIKS